MKKALGITAWILMIFLLAAYGIGCGYFQEHFYYGTAIDGTVYGCLTVSETAAQMIRKQDEYKLNIKGRDQLEVCLAGAEAGLCFEPEEELEQILERQIPAMWPVSFFESHVYELKDSLHMDKEVFRKNVLKLSLFDEQCMQMPSDARISDYSSEEKGYYVVPEEEGSLILKEKALKTILDAIQSRQTELDLTGADYYVRPTVFSDDTGLCREVEERNTYTKLTFTYDMHGVEARIDGDQIHEWLTEKDGTIQIDPEKAAAYVQVLADTYDTYKNDCTFITAKGEEKLLTNKQYGWQLDVEEEQSALLAMLEEKKSASREPVWKRKGYAEGEAGIGDTYVEIDLTDQYLYVISDGEVILESDIVSGNAAKGWDTPAGIFRITGKTRNKVLRGPGYASPVSYWMPFNKNIGMHDATWRSKFGETIYKKDGSHGCINLPLAKAKEIYNFVKTNMPVVCYY